jgi:predicted nucleic acid-binding protein
MTGKYFLDTNFLVYCFSKNEEEKQQKCLALLREAKGRVKFVLSTQVLNEFAAVMLGKLKHPPNEVKAILDDLALFEVIAIDIVQIKYAIDLHILHKISFWDSLIVSAAKSSHCHTILTEDLQHGGIIAGIRVQNPFEE